jgi:hypothetical protein
MIMTYSEAMNYADNINETCDNNRAVVVRILPEWAVVVRILPESIDPADPNDNGWDVEITTYK